MKQILIYQGPGVDRASFINIKRALVGEVFLQKFTIQEINAQQILHDEWESKTVLFILPGGRDQPYHRSLQGLANRRLYNYVANGGSYFGICAGAYYGCQNFEFEKGTSLEVIAERELAFFPGKAIGPAYGNGQFEYRSQRGARLAKLCMADQKEMHCYFNGGCYFVNPCLYPQVHVLARYCDLADRQAAILSCQVGKGKALLSGVHPELYYDYEGYSFDSYFCELLPAMKEYNEERGWLWRYLLKQFTTLSSDEFS